MQREDPAMRIKLLFEKKDLREDSVHSEDSDKIKDIESAISPKSRRKLSDELMDAKNFNERRKRAQTISKRGATFLLISKANSEA